MEQWGNDYLTNSTTGAAHIGSCPFSPSTHFYQNFSSYLSNGSFADDFHVYSIIWKEDTIRWYVDEIEIFSINPSSYFTIPSQHSWPFNSNEWYLMINLAIPSSGPNANTIFPNHIDIDYVRVYKDNLTNIDNTIKNNFVDYIPNNGFINLNGDYCNVSVYDIEGRLVLYNSYSNNIYINNLEQGIYLIVLENLYGLKMSNKIIIN